MKSKQGGVEVNADKLSTRSCIEITIQDELTVDDSYLFLTKRGEFHIIGKNVTKKFYQVTN